MHIDVKNLKSFLSHTAHRAARLLSPQQDTSLHCKTTDG